MTAFAKAFGSYHRLARFRDVCIKKNDNISPEHKHVFLALFKIVCPRFVDQRWHYLYETLGWILPRQAALKLLRLDDLLQGAQMSHTADSEHSLSQAEYEMLRCMQTQNDTSTRFWAMASLCQQLADWGRWFSVMMHSCPCRCNEAKEAGQSQRKKSCPMIGRTAVLLAAGLPDVALAALRQISARLPQHVQEAISNLQQQNPTESQELLRDFNTAIGRLAFRTKQNFSYWQELPWALLIVMRPWVEKFDSMEEESCL